MLNRFYNQFYSVIFVSNGFHNPTNSRLLKGCRA